MAELQDTDKFLVNRSGNSYQLKKETLMAELRDDDLMLVNRAGISYKATGAEIKESFGPEEEPPEIDSVALTEVENGYRYTDKHFPYTVDMAVDGEPAPGYALKAKLSGTTFNFAVESDSITKVEGAGENVYATDTIASVAGNVLTFPTDKDFDKFEVGDVVQGAWNQSEVWSNNLTSPGTIKTPTSGFDGSTAGSMAEGVGGLTLTPTVGIAYSASVEVYVDGPSKYNVNGGGWVTNPTGSGATWMTVVSGSGTLNTFNSLRTDNPSYDAGWKAIRVDGKILVDPSVSNPNAVSITAIDAAGPTITTDGGSWLGADGSGDAGDGRYEPSQVWSDQKTGGPGTNNTNAFDGNPTTKNVVAASDGDSNVVWTLTGLTAGQSVKIKTQGQGFSNNTICNGTIISDKSGTPVITDCGVLAGTTLTITQEVNPGETTSDASNIFYVEVGGAMLVDTSIPGAPGATDITKTEAYSTKLTVASDKDLDVITGGIYMTDGTVKQDGSGELEPASYTPQTSEIASVTQKSIAFTAAGLPTIGTLADATDDDLTTYANFSQSSELTITSNIDNVTKLGFITSSPNDNVRLYVNGSDNKGLETNRIDYGGGLFIQEWVFPEQSLSEFKFSTTHLSGGSNYRINNVLVNGSSLNNQGITLTFNSPNPDLQYFQVGDAAKDGKWNQSQEWSNRLTSSTGSFYTLGAYADGPLLAFNGDINRYGTIAGVDADADAIWTPSSPIAFNTLKIYYYNGEGLGAGLYIDLGSGYGANLIGPTGSAGVYELNTPGTITAIKSSSIGTSTYIELLGIEIDSKLLVDTSVPGGVLITGIDTAANTMTVAGGDWLAADTWNQSQEWSSSISLSDPFTKGSLAKLFNGVLTDSCGISASAAAVTGTTLTLSQPITDVTKVEIGCYSPSDDTNYNEYRVNAEPLVSTASLGSGNVITLYDGSPLTLTSIFGQSSTDTTSLEFLWIKVNGSLLVDTSVSGGQTVVTGSTETAEGTFLSATGTEVDLSASSGRWIADNKAGIPFSFVPSTPIVDTQNEAYGKLQIVGDKAMVTGIQADDPGFTNVTRKDYAITFPAAFATGNTPDDDLPMGSSISAIVRAKNSEGESIKESNILLPSLPNPEGSAGPITGATEAELTVGTSANLNSFIVDDALVMVDDTGAVASYTPQTSEIASVAGNVLTFNTPNPDLQFFQPGDNVGTPGGFTPVLYTGNGGTQSIDCGFSPSLVWIKSRTATYNHVLFDSIRGAGNSLSSNATGETVFDLDTLSSFDSDGFSVGSNPATNLSNIDYAAWCWDAGATTVTNNDGTIESQVRSNGNFSVVKYEGTGANGTFGHGLTTAPAMVIIKQINGSGFWVVGHKSLDYSLDNYLKLNDANAVNTANNEAWQSTAPTSSVVPIGISIQINASNSSNIAYCWAETPGVSSFGEYDGGTNNRVIDCGFKPAFVLIKCTSVNGESWNIHDSARDPSNPSNTRLTADTADAESSNAVFSIDFTPTGFTLTNTNDSHNATGKTYIYAAFAGSNPIEVIGVDVAANAMTVDGGLWEGSNGSASSGTWDKSQEWSAGGSGTMRPDWGWDQAFNGVLTTSGFNGNVAMPVENAGGGSWTGKIDTAGKPVTLHYWHQVDDPGQTILINGQAVSLVPTGPGSVTIQQIDISAQAGNAITAMQINRSITTDGAIGIAGIEVMGKLLVDTSVSGGPVGETVVTGPAKSGVATFVSTNGTDTMSVENSNNQWIDNTNRLAEEFFIKKIFTALNANDPAHVEMQKAVNEAFDAFPKNVQARKTQIAKSFTKLVAGAAITKAELNALRKVMTAWTDEEV